MGYFTLARKVDPRYKTNLLILIMTIILLLVRGLITNDWGGSVSFSIGFFLSWALAREIDPLHEKSAFVVAFIYLTMGMWMVDINLGLVFWMVLLLRGITKITGKTPTAIDLLSLLGLGIYLINGQENGIYGLIFTLAMIIAYRRFAKEGMFKVFIGLGILVSVWGISSYSVSLREAALRIDSLPLILLVLGLGIFYGRMLQKDQGIRDDLGNLMESNYVLLSYLFYLGTYVVLILATDLEEGSLGLLFAVILGVSVYRVWLMISKKE